QVAERGEIRHDSNAAVAAREVLETYGGGKAQVAVPCRRQQRETQIGYAHQYEGEQDRSLQAQPRIQNSTDEDPDEKCPEAEADVVHGDFVVGVAEVVEQQ